MVHSPHQTPESAGSPKQDKRPAISEILPDGTIVETLFRPDERRTLFCVCKDGEIRYEENLAIDGERLVPYLPTNPLLVNHVVLFPTEPEEYGSVSNLLAEIQAYIHRYVDLSPLFEKVASYYVLFSWVYDAFKELPYLRVRGDAGSGKTRFLKAVGSICYKPIFTSGAATVSPIFRLLEAFRGTLLFDEADFRLSTEQSEIVKILNCGNGAGTPVVRSETTPKREFYPAAYHVFGPKLIATRGFFEDRALESRCLTEEMGHARLRRDIPISTPESLESEALHLRNKLLLFRLRTREKCAVNEALADRSIEPRLSQVFTPLLSIIEDAEARAELQQLARQYHRELVTDRGQGAEAQVLEVIQQLIATQESRPSVKEISTWFADRHQEEYKNKITAQWVGSIIRNKLQIKTQKSRGVFVIPPWEDPKLKRLYEKHGIGTEGETEEEPVGGPEALPEPVGGHGGEGGLDTA